MFSKRKVHIIVIFFKPFLNFTWLIRNKYQLTFTVSSGKFHLQFHPIKSGSVQMIQSVICIARIFKRRAC